MARLDKRDGAAGVAGILVIDKPAGRSSMAVVAEVRRRAGGVRTGHAGTLDPLATGVLVLGLGAATKQIDVFMGTDKAYRTRIDLSAFTTTDDREGEREQVEVSEPPEQAAIEAALEPFRGTIQQAPPAYSAIKVGGKRAYRLARGGAPPEIPPRTVIVHSLRLMSYDWPIVELSLRCGKGFYVRSLARDLGRALGTGGHCVEIRRTAVGPFTLADAITLDALPAPLTQAALLPLGEALARVSEHLS